MTFTWLELWRVFAKIGIMSFGGPAAQIGVMHRELVEDRHWLTQKQFLNALSFCMLLPGPEAMQLATYCGWRLRGVAGGLIAGGLFVVPGAIVMLALVALYAHIGEAPFIESLFLGIKAAVVIVVLEALLKVARKALQYIDRWILAALSFAAIFFFAVPFPLIIAAAAGYGAWKGGTIDNASPLPAKASTMRTILIWGTLWWAPIAALWAAGQQALADIGLFFSKLAIVTFGGAYAVLAYMTQEAVHDQRWLTTPEMMDGLGLAETTPGPLILVTEFVGFLAGFNAGGWALAIAAALLTLWVTFVPCFLWIFAGAPYIEWISTRSKLAGALSAITAAVVGVILNLSLWFAMHVFFNSVASVRIGPLHLLRPDLSTLDWRTVALAIGAGYALLRLKLGLLPVLALSAAAGALLGLLQLA